MEQMCSKYCKSRLSDYRDMNRKLYNDLDAFDDMRDKDVFIQKLSKERNGYQKEFDTLKKKYDELRKENDDLVEQNNQLDEDTDDGVEMLKRAHEREAKLKKELEEFKQSKTKGSDNFAKIKDEKAELQKKYDFLKIRLEQSLRENQNLLNSKELEIHEIKDEFLAVKENLDKERIESKNKVSESEFKEKEYSLEKEALKDEIRLLKQKNTDLNDELVLKSDEMISLEDNSRKASLQNSASSLKEELDQIQFFGCDHCALKFASLREFKLHMREIQREKLNTLERKGSEQKVLLSSSIFKLKVKEDKRCYCKLKKVKGVIVSCRINHLKHNFVKSKSEECFKVARPFFQNTQFLINYSSGSANQTTSENILHGGAIKKCYTCKVCNDEFTTQGDFKKHRKSFHTEEKQVDEFV